MLKNKEQGSQVGTKTSSLRLGQCLTDFKQAIRNIFYSVAKQHVDKANQQEEKPLAAYSNEELKEELERLEKKTEEVKKEMKHRGIR